MNLLLNRLPNLTLVSVAHRSTLSPFHTHEMDFDGGGAAMQNPIVRDYAHG
jgi:vitamin B12/bleomycin/antimicrobial peptide transport system ATP-binding/permease protein